MSPRRVTCKTHPPIMRRRRCPLPLRSLMLTALVAHAPSAAGQTKSIEVSLKLETGGAITGLVVDHNDHGIVVVNGSTPHVFAWDDVETRTAYVAKRDLAALARGGQDDLTAADHFSLGLFALSRDRRDLAAMHFGRAGSLDGSYRPRARAAVDESRAQRRAAANDNGPLEEAAAEPSPQDPPGEGLVERIDAGLPAYDASDNAAKVTPEMRARAMEVYKGFDRAVKELFGDKVAHIETDHFLIWTDWDERDRPRLSQWCEAMYAAVADAFGFDPHGSVFLAKCPVFCWRSKVRYVRFAEHFDAYDGRDSVGYTRSIEKNGHVHLVLLRRGTSARDFNRFAATLVHEGTHAFVHRMYSTRLIPHWINEGYAEWIAERVLGDRCPAKENAELLARQFVRYNWPITPMLHGVGPIEVHQYPLAHSVVSHLQFRGTERFADLVRRLKRGESVAEALAASYDGLTLDALETRWLDWIRASDEVASGE